jgi:hypothetical protein
MTNLIGSTKEETKRNCISFAFNNNYNVSKEHAQIKETYLKTMSQIHKNNKEGNYEKAILLKTAVQTLSTWI